MVMITLYVRQQKRHRCIEQSFGLYGRGRGGMIWENSIETCIISYKKRITSPGSMQDTGCLGLVIRFLYDIIYVSMPFCQIIPPSPSPTESKRLFYTSVSLLLSRIQGYHYHLSKVHIYTLVYCIGIFLSGLLHSVY